MKRTYEELETEPSATKIEQYQVKDFLTKALEQILLLQKEVTELKNQLNKNSNNSSKPPSTDQIDKTVECSMNDCPCCGSKHIEDLSAIETLQQIEIT